MITRSRIFEVARFLLAGTLTTILSYAVYLVLLIALPYMAAYVISFIAGIVFSYFINTYFVFSERFSWQSLIKYPLVYVAQLAINLVIVWASVDTLGIRKELAPLVAILVSIPVTYALSRAVIKKSV